MNTATLVRTSADVVTITTLRPGDVYKRLAKPSYGDGYEAYYGIVQTVDSNGADALITTLEFHVDYSKVEPKLQFFGTGTDLKLFAATPDEIGAHLSHVAEVAARRLVEAHKARDAAEQVVAAVERIRETSALTTAETATTAEIPA